MRIPGFGRTAGLTPEAPQVALLFLNQRFDPLQHPADLAVVRVDLAGNFVGRETLKPQRQDLLLLRRQPAEEVVQLVDERDHCHRRRLLGHHLHDIVLGQLPLRGLVSGVAAGGPVVGDLPQRLVQGDTDKELGQIVVVGDFKLVVFQAGEERAKD